MTASPAAPANAHAHPSLPEPDATGRALSAALSDRLRARIAAEVIALDDGLSLTVTSSFGVTACREGDDSASLLARADALLYEAKQAGRNRVASSA